MTFGFTHAPLVGLSRYSLTSFFREIDVIGTENVPQDHGPMLVACSHSNMAVDPAVLSSTMPNHIPLHYWVKDGLFANPAVASVLLNAGNIPVDRKNKNNQSLFKGTFEALAQGECVAVFPEGTSHTSPHMLPFKDGTSWAALEYLKYLSGIVDGKKKEGSKKAIIVPVGINYVDKAKYRSRIVVEYGPPITMDDFESEFMSDEEGAAKHAVKRLTKKLELEMMKLTINAPDWDTMVAGKMSRELLWEDERKLAPEHYVKVSQTLVDLFSDPITDSTLAKLKEILVVYNNLLIVSKLSNQQLSDLPLPINLDPSRPAPIPNRFSTLSLLIRDSIGCAIRLPFYTVPLLIHIPIYIMAKFGANIAKEELETQAQMKIAFAILFSFLIYPVLFFVLWLVLGFTAVGALVAFGSVYVFNMSHTTAIDETYSRWKRLIAAWRVLIGVWRPKGELELAKILSYLPSSSAPAGATIDATAWQSGVGPKEKAAAEKLKEENRKRIPTRRLVKHVLRTRAEAARLFESYLVRLSEKDGLTVNARPWLAGETDIELGEEGSAGLPTSKRSGKEVVEYLRSQGARILPSASSYTGWQALSGDEGEDEEH